MKLFGLLRKPDWEHANPERRARAVARSDDAALLAKLAELAQADPAPAVRIAALARLDDLSLLERRLRGERDAEVAAVARQRLNTLLGGSAPPGGEALVGQLLDDPLLAQLASQAATPVIRRAAISRLDRASVWIERCQNDADAALRLWALERIEGADALARIADAVRKRDKRLARAARDKLEALGLAAGDPEALRRRALEIADSFGQLARQLPDDREPRMQALRGDWAALREQLDADLQRRVDGAEAMADAALAGARGELPQSAPTATDSAPDDTVTNTDADASPGEDPALAARQALDALHARLPAPEQADALAVLDRLEAELAALSPAPPVKPLGALRGEIAARRQSIRERQGSEQRAAQEAAFDAAAKRLEEALDAGHPGPAREAREACAPLARSAVQQRRLAASDTRLAELERWQRWSGNKARQRLCDEVAALAGSGLHPDALATRLRELQDEWAKLDAIDGEAAPGREHGLTKRFRGLCARAIAPARPYFEKRDSLRRERAESLDALLGRSAELPGGDALRELRRDIAAALRGLDAVPPAQRGEYGRRLRERLAAIDAAQGEARESAALDKRRLLARLRRDLGATDAESRVALAKAAQAEWKRLPRADRDTENALWAELRELIDPLFSAERERGAARESERVEQRQAAQAILDELAALASADEARLQHAGAHLEQLVSRWRALPAESELAPPARTERPERGRRPPPRRTAAHPWQARFDRAQAEVEAAIKAAGQRREQAVIDALCAAGSLLDALDAAAAEQRDALREQFAALALGQEDRQLLDARLDADPADALDADSAERLVVEAELIAGLDSPAASAGIRRELQMQRLAAKLEGAVAEPPARALRDLLRQLQARRLGADAAPRETLLQRWRSAWAALPG